MQASNWLDKGAQRRQQRAVAVAALVGVVVGFFVSQLTIERSTNTALRPADSSHPARALAEQHPADYRQVQPAGTDLKVLISKDSDKSAQQRRREYQDWVIAESERLRPVIRRQALWSTASLITTEFHKFWNDKREQGVYLGDRIYLPIYWWNVLKTTKRRADVQEKVQPFLDSLDKEYKYFSVIWAAKGLSSLRLRVPDGLDLLLFQTGGATRNARNIPMPLLKRVREPEGHPKTRLVNFIGTARTHQVRVGMNRTWAEDPDFYFANKVSDYRQVLEESNFTLAPRGFGSSSFRMYEALQLGSVPIYVWDLEYVLPMEEYINWNEMAIVINGQEIDRLKDRMSQFDLEKAQQLMVKWRHLFTYEGCLDYMLQRLQTEPLNPVPVCTFEDTISRLLSRNVTF